MRPRSLLRLRAVSAAFNRLVTDSDWEVIGATPILTLTSWASPSHSIFRLATAREIFFMTILAVGKSQFSSSIPNLSLPMRATTSCERTILDSVCPTFLISKSPASRPLISFTTAMRSISTLAIAWLTFSPESRLSKSRRISSKLLLLSSPVSESKCDCAIFEALLAITSSRLRSLLEKSDAFLLLAIASRPIVWVSLLSIGLVTILNGISASIPSGFASSA